MQGFGNRLLWLRELHEEREPGRHSQTQWARRIGVTLTMYHRWEKGTHLPKLVHQLRIATLFRVSPNYLVAGVLPVQMERWLYEGLRQAHPELQDEATLWDRQNTVFEQASREYRHERDS